MTAREMHIDLKISIQQANASRSRKWLAEELDLILTKMQDRLIRSKLKKRPDGSGGFEIDQVGADDIRSLIKTGVPISTYILDDKRYIAYLPYDYNYLLSDSSLVTNLCGAAAGTPVPSTIYINRLRQDKSAKVGAYFYETMELVIGATTVTIPGDLPYNNQYLGFRAIEDVSFLSEFISLKGKWYWEKLGELYYPGHYISVTDTIPGAMTITIDGTITTPVSATDTVIKTTHPGVGVPTSNRLTATNKISSLNQAAFWRTSYYSPISELVNNTLYIYRHDSFTVNGATIDYIRKPQSISLSLGTDCQLPEGTHQPICDLAAEYIKGTVGDQTGTQLKKIDITERVIL